MAIGAYYSDNVQRKDEEINHRNTMNTPEKPRVARQLETLG